MSDAIDKQITGMLLLRKAVRRERQWQLFFACLLLLIGALITIFYFGSNIVLSIFSLICLLVGAKLTHSFILKQDIDNAQLFRLLRHQPSKIVWVYSVVTERLPFGLQMSKNGIMYFKMLNKDEISVSVPIKDIIVISEALNGLLPHATFGYTRDREQWYLAAPEMLLRDEEEL